MLIEADGNIAVGTTSFTVPTDFLSPLTLRFVNGVGCYSDPIAFVTEAEANRRRQQQRWYRQPWYTIFNKTVEIVGPVSTTLPIPYELRYYQRIPSLLTNATNWLLTKSPDLYLYGSMLEGEAYLMGDDRIPIWKSAYDMIIADMQLESDRARFPQGALNSPNRTFG